MFYTTLLRGSFLSDTAVSDAISDIFSADRLTEEETDTIFDKVVKEVNANLPEDMEWSPYLGQITGYDTQDITEEEFNDYLNDAFTTVLADY